MANLLPLLGTNRENWIINVNVIIMSAKTCTEIQSNAEGQRVLADEVLFVFQDCWKELLL